MLGRMGLSWRVFAGLAATPAALAFILTFVALPESPRFYANKVRYCTIKGFEEEQRAMYCFGAMRVGG